MDFPHDQESKLKSTESSHNSAIKFPFHVESYVHTEMKHAAIYGPYKNPPYCNSTQASPIMSREKADSHNRRITIDFSWPPEESINSCTAANLYLTTAYKLQYPTIDNVTDHLNSLEEDSELFKIDLSRAFRQLRIDPRDYNLLTLKCGDHFYSDVYCPFGHRGGSMTYTGLTNFFRYLMSQQGYTIFNYIYDLVGIDPLSSVEKAYKFFLELLEKLGFQISGSKLEPLSRKCNSLGVIIDTKNTTLSVPQGKLLEIVDKCRNALDNTSITKQQLQSIIGSLMFVAKCVKPSRYFVNRLLDALREATGKIIPLNENMKNDLHWFLTFLPCFNGTVTYKHQTIEQVQTLAIDVCLKGWGCMEKSSIYSSHPIWL